MNKPLSQNSVQKIVENALRSWWISAKTTREKSIFIAEALCVTCRYSEEVSTVRVVDQITKVLSAKNNAGKIQNNFLLRLRRSFSEKDSYVRN
jgi:hypothetical protein